LQADHASVRNCEGKKITAMALNDPAYRLFDWLSSGA